MPGLAVATVFLVLVLVTIVLGVRIVPQGSKQVVQRLGKYHKTLGPGLNLIVPYIDTVAYKITTKDIVLDIKTDPALIGGVVTKIGDLVLDGSIKTQLLNMRESLKRGESV